MIAAQLADLEEHHRRVVEQRRAIEILAAVHDPLPLPTRAVEVAA